MNPNSNNDSLVSSVKSKALTIAKKTILDILAKCFYNNSIKFLVEALLKILQNDDGTLSKEFLAKCFEEDDCKYLFEVMLECTDSTTRFNVG